jgi:hypothetical protein
MERISASEPAARLAAIALTMSALSTPALSFETARRCINRIGRKLNNAKNMML